LHFVHWPLFAFQVSDKLTLSCVLHTFASFRFDPAFYIVFWKSKQDAVDIRFSVKLYFNFNEKWICRTIAVCFSINTGHKLNLLLLEWKLIAVAAHFRLSSPQAVFFELCSHSHSQVISLVYARIMANFNSLRKRFTFPQKNDVRKVFQVSKSVQGKTKASKKLVLKQSQYEFDTFWCLETSYCSPVTLLTCYIILRANT
jgi:hypothetical protein